MDRDRCFVGWPTQWMAEPRYHCSWHAEPLCVAEPTAPSLMPVDPNLSPPSKSGFTELMKKVGETAFYKKALIYRSAFLRGGIGIAIAILVWDTDHPGDWKGSVLQGLIAWRLFIDSSMSQVKEEIKKL